MVYCIRKYRKAAKSQYILLELFRNTGVRHEKRMGRALGRHAAGNPFAAEISDQFELSPATVSHHLSVLKGCGLIKCERRAQTLIYSINLPAFHALAKELTRIYS